MDDVRNVEARLGWGLPADYVQFLLISDGGRVAPNQVPTGKRGLSSVKNFLDLETACQDLATVRSRSSRRWPIAEDWSGNYFLLVQYRRGWRIAFWDHETERTTVLAGSFAEFRAKLESPEPAAPLDPARVLSTWIRPDMLALFGKGDVR